MGKKQKLLVTPAMIADAIVKLYPFHFSRYVGNEQLFDFLKTASWQKSNCIWEQICICIFPDKDPRTIKSYVPKAYKTFLRHFDDICRLLETLLKVITDDRSCGENIISTNHHETLNFDVASSSDTSILADVSKFESSLRTEGTCDLQSSLTKSPSPINDSAISGPLFIPRDVESSAQKENLATFSCFSTEITTNVVDDCEFSNLSLTSCPDSSVLANDDLQTNSTNILHDARDKIIQEREKRSSPLPNSESSVSGNPILREMWVTVPSTFWQKFWSKDLRLRRGWTDALYDIVKSSLICNLSFRWHKCSIPKSKISKSFQAYAICTFSTCTSFKFLTTEPIFSPFRDIRVRIVPMGVIHHVKGETHRRFVTGEKRLALSKTLQVEAPSTVKQEMMTAANTTLLEAGNLNDVCSLTILQKISSDNGYVYTQRPYRGLTYIVTRIRSSHHSFTPKET